MVHPYSVVIIISALSAFATINISPALGAPFQQEPKLAMPTINETTHSTSSLHLYPYGDIKENAIELYREAWSEILILGRWSQAEKLFREAIEIDPSFVIGKALVARISGDLAERKALLAEIEKEMKTVDADGRLILDIFIKNIEAMNLREEGKPIPETFSEEQVTLALKNFSAFLEKYPHEVGIQIEYIEWLHAANGAKSALAEVQKRVKKGYLPTQAHAFFTAYLNTEVGNQDRALLAATAFERALNNPDLPQPYYLYAYVYRHFGRLTEAKTMIERAIKLDQNHLIARQLQSDINRAQENSSVTSRH